MNITKRAILLAGLAIGVIAITYRSAPAGNEVVIGQPTSASNQTPANKIDHTLWDKLLAEFVDERGMVDYTGWKRSAEATNRLDDYLTHLSTAKFQRDTTPAVKLAYWINAYNAVTVKGILREYPTTSIRNHTAKLYGYNIWKDLKLRVDGELYSLDTIEHKLLRKMDEPRIHFAIVCASIGCPKLLNEAYAPDSIDDQLTLSAKYFFADSEKFQSDPQQGRFAVSPILKWFGEDFGKDRSSRLQTIAPFLPDERWQAMARSGNIDLSYLDYDWDLNDQAKQ